MSNYHDELWFKMQNRILDSSIWEEDLATRVVFVTLLALAQMPENRKAGRGVVAITRSGLARKAIVNLEQLDHAIMRLTTPDPSSRSQPSERLEVLPNGYRILNFSRYHDCEKWEEDYEKKVKAGRARSEGSKRDALGRFHPAPAGQPSSTDPTDAGGDPVRLDIDVDVDVDQTRRRPDQTETPDTTEGVEDADDRHEDQPLASLEYDAPVLDESIPPRGNGNGAGRTNVNDDAAIPDTLVERIQALPWPHGTPSRDSVLSILRFGIPAKHHADLPNILKHELGRNPHLTEFRQVGGIITEANDRWLESLLP